jgi:hypothetical protein
MCILSIDCHCLSVAVGGREGGVQTYVAFAVNVRALRICFAILFYTAVPALQGDPFSQEDTQCTKECWVILMSYVPSADKTPCSAQEL